MQAKPRYIKRNLKLKLEKNACRKSLPKSEEVVKEIDIKIDICLNVGRADNTLLEI